MMNKRLIFLFLIFAYNLSAMNNDCAKKWQLASVCEGDFSGLKTFLENSTKALEREEIDVLNIGFEKYPQELQKILNGMGKEHQKKFLEGLGRSFEDQSKSSETNDSIIEEDFKSRSFGDESNQDILLRKVVEPINGNDFAMLLDLLFNGLYDLAIDTIKQCFLDDNQRIIIKDIIKNIGERWVRREILSLIDIEDVDYETVIKNIKNTNNDADNKDSFDGIIFP